MLISEEESVTAGGVSVGRRRRRRWSEAQKRQIVAETHEPGVSVPMVAQRYNLNANQIFRWRHLFREAERAGATGRFVPVVVEAAPGEEPGAATISPQSDDGVAMGAPARGRMEIVLSGDRRVIVDRTVDPSALSRVACGLRRMVTALVPTRRLQVLAIPGALDHAEPPERPQHVPRELGRHDAC